MITIVASTSGTCRTLLFMILIVMVPSANNKQTSERVHAHTHLVRDRSEVRLHRRRDSEPEVRVRAVPALHAQVRFQGLVVDVTTLEQQREWRGRAGRGGRQEGRRVGGGKGSS